MASIFLRLIILSSTSSFRRKTKPVPPGQRRPTNASLAKEVEHPSVDSKKVASWYSAGTRLIYLAAACKFILPFSHVRISQSILASMYIVPMIAVAGLKRLIYKTDNILTIELLSYLLCNPHRKRTSVITF